MVLGGPSPNIVRSHLKISLKSFKNLLTFHAEDMKLIVDAILRRSHHEYEISSWDLHEISKIFLKIYKKIDRRFYKKIFWPFLTIKLNISFFLLFWVFELADKFGKNFGRLKFYFFRMNNWWINGRRFHRSLGLKKLSFIKNKIKIH